VLANLPDQQRIMVADQIEAMKKDYVIAASVKHKSFRKYICRFADARRRCHGQACELFTTSRRHDSDRPPSSDSILLSEKISSYYVEQAGATCKSRRLRRGLGCSTWASAALQTRTGSCEGRDGAVSIGLPAARTASMGVVVRDRPPAGRAWDLPTDWAMRSPMAGNLELAVKVVRHYVEDPAAVQPDFVLIGEILEIGS